MHFKIIDYTKPQNYFGISLCTFRCIEYALKLVKRTVFVADVSGDLYTYNNLRIIHIESLVNPLKHTYRNLVSM